MMAVIFIAIPTKGTVKDGALTEEFLRKLAELHLAYPEHVFIAPMVQDYQLLKYMPQTDATWEAWGNHCRALIARCDQVWVLMYPGWVTSVGVAGEIDCARECEKLVKFVGV